MPKADSLKSILDTALSTSQDSLIKPDSILVPDTSLIPVIQNIKFSGYEGVFHPSFPATENWVFIALLILLGMSAFSFLRSSGWFIESFRTFFTVKDRGSIFNKSTMSDYESRIFLILFSIGVFSLFAYSILYSSERAFLLITFLKFSGATGGFFLIKYLIIRIIGYVFLHPTIQKLTIESYYNVLTYLGLVLFPMMILHIYLPENLKYYIIIASLILCIVAVLVYTVKLFLIFFNKLASTFYLLLYLCTLEILPVVLLFYLYNFIILSV